MMHDMTLLNSHALRRSIAKHFGPELSQGKAMIQIVKVKPERFQLRFSEVGVFTVDPEITQGSLYQHPFVIMQACGPVDAVPKNVDRAIRDAAKIGLASLRLAINEHFTPSPEIQEEWDRAMGNKPTITQEHINNVLGAETPTPARHQLMGRFKDGVEFKINMPVPCTQDYRLELINFLSGF